jgi:hypothetical protein
LNQVWKGYVGGAFSPIDWVIGMFAWTGIGFGSSGASLVFRRRIFWLRQMRFVNASMLYHIPSGIGSRLMGLGLFVLISALGQQLR